jgi:predicted anti-sigma-YlaC factor YlaD
VDCDQVRQAVSAQIDGEDPGLPPVSVDGHLAGCAECRGWRQRAHLVTRHARLARSFLDHDLTQAVLASVPDEQRPRWPRKRSARLAGGGVMRLAGFALLLALVFLGAHAAGAHLGPLTPGHGRVQYTGGGTGGTGTGGGANMGGMTIGGAP